MILLSEDEICEITGTVPFGSTYSAKENEVNFSWGGVRELNKAQLKKVVECFEKEFPKMVGLKATDLPLTSIWKSILKECE